MNNIPTNMHAHVGGDEEGWTRWMIPSSPTLRNTAANTTEPAVLHSTCASGSQLCSGQQGNLLINPIIGVSRVVSSCLVYSILVLEYSVCVLIVLRVYVPGSRCLLIVLYLLLVDRALWGIILSANHRANGAITSIGVSS